jgi:drug/metabolite transporter (DMT)-like permease
MCYGCLSTIVKLAFQQGFTPAEIISGLVTFGCFMLWLFAIPLWKKLREIPMKNILLLILSGAVWGLTEIFYTVSLSKIPASIAVILLFQFTWMTQIVHMKREKTRLSKNHWLGLGSILFGTIFSSGFHLDDLIGLNILGVLLGLCAAISYTATLFISETVATDVTPLLRSSLLATGQMLFIFIIFPPTFLFSGALEQGLWMWIGLLGMIGIVITTFTYNKGIPHIGSGLAGILGSIELPIVLVLASTVLKESVLTTQWLGVGFILLGIVLTSINPNNSPVPVDLSKKM